MADPSPPLRLGTPGTVATPRAPAAAAPATSATNNAPSRTPARRRRRKQAAWAEISPERIKHYNEIRAEVIKEQEDHAPPSPRLAYNDKLRATQDDALRLVNYLNMSAFRKQFQQQEGSVDLATFCQIVRKITSSRKGRKAAAELVDTLDHEGLTARLIELFYEIDLDGDGEIVWEEFTKFILDKASQLSGGKEMVKILEYYPARKSWPTQRHKNPVEKICVLANKKLLAFVEEGTHTIHFHDMSHSNCPPTSYGEIHVKSDVMAMTYIPDMLGRSFFVTVHADLVMRTWNLDEGPLSTRWRMHSSWPVAASIECITWVPTHRLIFTGSISGEAQGWSLIDKDLKMVLRGHSDAVLMMLPILELHLLVSASLDGSICIWDIYMAKTRQRLTGHSKGVSSLAFEPSQRLLLSGGYDHEVLVWSLFVNSLVYRLSGHGCPVVALLCNVKRSELISGDAHGALKVWDLTNFKCVQSFGTPERDPDSHGGADKEAISSLDALQVGPEQTRLVVAGGKRILFYDQERKPAVVVTDDMPITCACFNSVLLTIVTAAGRTVKVWDAILGSIKGCFPLLTKHDITAMSLDDRMRKIIVGDNQGNLDVVTHHSGSWMKSFDKCSQSSVVRIVYMGHSKAVLVAFADCSIRLFDEGPIQNCPMVRIFEMEKQNVGDLTSLCYSPFQQGSRGPFVASGSGTVADPIKLWNVMSAKCDSTLTVQDDCDYSVLSMMFLDPAPLLAVSCSDGYIRVWATWAMVGARRVCILAFPNVDPQGYEEYTYDREEEEPYPLFHPADRGPEEEGDWEYEGPHDEGGQPKGNGRRPSTASRAVPTIAELKTRVWATRPRFDSPRRVVPIPALGLAWDMGDKALYTGDESGRLRKWCLSAFFDKLQADRLLVPEVAGWRHAVVQEKHHRRDDNSQLLSPELAKLWWTAEAHDDAINVVDFVTEPRSILSAGNDQCTKMWDTNGRPIGTLVQGLEAGNKNNLWDLWIDVEERERQEQNVIELVNEQVLNARRQRKTWGVVQEEAPELDLQSLTTMNSTLDETFSVVTNSTLDTYSMSDTNTMSQSMTTISGELNQRMLTYLAEGKHVFQPGMTSWDLDHPPTLRVPPTSTYEKRLKALQISLTERALRSLGAEPMRPFSAKEKKTPRSGRSKPGHRLGNDLPPLHVTFRDMPPLNYAIPLSPGRKECMSRSVEDTIIILRRKLNEIEQTEAAAVEKPNIFNGKKSRFRDFAKNVISPMISTEASIVSGASTSLLAGARAGVGAEGNETFTSGRPNDGKALEMGPHQSSIVSE